VKTKYICENFGDCEQADSFESFELEEHEEKCPKCGRDDTLKEENSIPRPTPFLDKLKTPLVTGVISGVSLLGGAAYYCLSGYGICFSDTNSTEEMVLKENETKVMPKEINSTIKLENEKKEAIRKMNNEWISIKDTKKIEDLEEFKLKYPNSKYTSDINIRIKSLQEKQEKDENTKKMNHEWSIVKNSTDIELLKEFNRRYPDSPYFSTIEIKIAELEKNKSLKEQKEKEKNAWLKIQRSSDVDNFMDYINKYPNSIYVDDAKNRMHILNEISKVWNKLKNSSNIDELKKFGNKHKEYRQKVASRISLLKKRIANQKFSLTIRKKPNDATVKIMDITPKYKNGIKVKRGKHLIEISADGYYTKKFSLNVQENLTTDIFKLTKKPAEVTHVEPKVTHVEPKVTHVEPEVTYVEHVEPKVIHVPAPITHKPTVRKSECTKLLDRIERYRKDGKEAKALHELNRFDANARNCTPAEQARGNKL